MDTKPLEWIDEDLWKAAWDRAMERYKKPEIAWDFARQYAVEAQQHRDRARIAQALENLTVTGLVQSFVGLANRVKPKPAATKGEGEAPTAPATESTETQERPKASAEKHPRAPKPPKAPKVPKPPRSRRGHG